MRDSRHQSFVDLISDALLAHGEKIVAASDEGPLDAAVALDNLIHDLTVVRDSLVLASVPNCSDPDCPVHGKTARATHSPNVN